MRMPVVVGRHRLEVLLRPELDPSAWAATDESTKQSVLACLVSREVGAATEKRRALEHPALVPTLDIVPKERLGDALADADPRGATLVITEALRGETLAEIIRRTGPADPASAVRVALVVGGALAAMHAKGFFHGGVSPLAIEVVDDTCPRLGIAGIQDLAIGYQSPGRFADEGLSAHDDAWSLLACLYYALSGAPPFQAETPGALARRVVGGRPPPLRASSPSEQDLQKLFDRGFSRSASRRYADIAALARDLRGWFEKHAPGAELPPEAALAPNALEEDDDDRPTQAPSISPPAVSSTPAPVSAGPTPSTPSTPSTPAAASTRSPPAPSEPRADPPRPVPAATDAAPLPEPPATRPVSMADEGVRPTLPTPTVVRSPDRRPLIAVAGLGLVLALGAALLRRSSSGASKTPHEEPRSIAAATSGPERVSAPSTPSTRPTSAAVASAPEALSSAGVPRPLTSASPLSAAELDVCVGAWFPRDTFDLDTDLGFVCAERDARRGNAKLRRAILAGGKNKKITDAMYEWGKFGWFELPVYATLRAKCCPGTPPVELPKVVGSTCAPPNEAVQTLANATAAGGDVAPAIRAFRKAVACLVEVGDYPAYGQPGPLGTTEEPAFRAFAARGQRP